MDTPASKRKGEDLATTNIQECMNDEKRHEHEQTLLASRHQREFDELKKCFVLAREGLAQRQRKEVQRLADNQKLEKDERIMRHEQQLEPEKPEATCATIDDERLAAKLERMKIFQMECVASFRDALTRATQRVRKAEEEMADNVEDE
ncbi:hypothetical protein BST61_g11489 [Cercospora zeina]